MDIKNCNHVYLLDNLDSLEHIQYCLDAGADVHALCDYALRYASSNGHVDTVKVLLNNGADVHARNNEALRYASYYGHTEVVKLLLDAKADVNSENNYALRYAIEKNHIKVVELLLEADVCAINDYSLRYISTIGVNYEMSQLLKKYKNRNLKLYFKIFKQKIKEFFKV